MARACTRFRVQEKSLCVRALVCVCVCLCAACARKTSARMWNESVYIASPICMHWHAPISFNFSLTLSSLLLCLFVCSSSSSSSSSLARSLSPTHRHTEHTLEHAFDSCWFALQMAKIAVTLSKSTETLSMRRQDN